MAIEENFFLTKQGFDLVYGDRPLKRTIQKGIQDHLALKLLEGVFSEGNKVLVDAERIEGR